MPRLLIVDDNENIHYDIKRVLTHDDYEHLDDLEMHLFGERDLPLEREHHPMDYTIDDAYRGEQAIMMVDEAAAKGDPYAVVFMDVRMPPGIDGVKAASEILKRHPQTEMVICSAHSDYSWTDMLKEIGISDKLQFLRKPFDMITVQQLALSCSRKWELELNTKRYIQQLEWETREKEEAHAQLANLNDELQIRIQNRGRELEHAKQHIAKLQQKLAYLEKDNPNSAFFRGTVAQFSNLISEMQKALARVSRKIWQWDSLGQELEERDLHNLAQQADLNQFFSQTGRLSNEIIQLLHTTGEALLHLAFNGSDLHRDMPVRRLMKSWLEGLSQEWRRQNNDGLPALAYRVPENLAWPIYPKLLAKVLHELIKNAYVHGYGSGEEAPVTIEAHESKEFMTIRILDHGKGIATEHSSRIYEPFFTTRPEPEYQGMGLSTAKYLVIHGMRGKLLCESNPGSGTCMSILLPRKENATAATDLEQLELTRLGT